MSLIKNKTLSKIEPVDFNYLLEDWDKPKTLQEIYDLVGKFPFTAKAVVDAEACGVFQTILPVGTILTLVAFNYVIPLSMDSLEKDGPTSSTIPRWLLIGD